MKIGLLILLFLIFSAPAFAERDYPSEYHGLITDLRFSFTPGYKSRAMGFTNPVTNPWYNVQGSIAVTSNSNDFAVLGEGFFRMTDPLTGEILFTRNGRFSRQPDGRWITRDGLILNSFRNSGDHPQPKPEDFELFIPAPGSAVFRKGSGLVFPAYARATNYTIFAQAFEMSDVDIVPLMNRLLVLAYRLKAKGGFSIDGDARIAILNELYRIVLESVTLEGHNPKIYRDMEDLVQKTVPYLTGVSRPSEEND